MANLKIQGRVLEANCEINTNDSLKLEIVKSPENIYFETSSIDGVAVNMEEAEQIANFLLEEVRRYKERNQLEKVI